MDLNTLISAVNQLFAGSDFRWCPGVEPTGNFLMDPIEQFLSWSLGKPQGQQPEKAPAGVIHVELSGEKVLRATQCAAIFVPNSHGRQRTKCYECQSVPTFSPSSLIA